MLTAITRYLGERMITSAFRTPVLAAIALASVAFSAAAAELPALPAGLTAVTKPIHLPAFNLATPRRRQNAGRRIKGKVLIARFWATW